MDTIAWVPTHDAIQNTSVWHPCLRANIQKYRDVIWEDAPPADAVRTERWAEKIEKLRGLAR